MQAIRDYKLLKLIDKVLISWENIILLQYLNKAERKSAGYPWKKLFTSAGSVNKDYIFYSWKFKIRERQVFYGLAIH
jgi:hypothetical protein